jgi:SynChlorMet cassette radical SAM/SPASM protein ScmE
MSAKSECPGPVAVLKTPRSLDLEITSRCNLRCSYCYYFDNPEVPYSDLPTGEWLRFIEELGRLAVMRVTLQGGEPLARDDFRELVGALAANGMRFSVLTNGTMITDETASFIAGTGRCDFVQVSIDGSRAEVHDRTRGRGSFDRAVAGLKRLQRRSVPVTARVTITRHNVDDLAGVTRFLLDDLGLPHFGTNAAGLMGSCMQSAGGLMLGVEERAGAMRELLKLAAMYPGRIQASAGPLAEARAWPVMVDAMRTNAAPFSDGGRLTGCGCHFTSCAVRADGAIVPCVLLAHMVMGRINRDSLAEIWRNSPILKSLRGRFSVPLKEFEFCRGCPYVPYCTGNCPGTAYSEVGIVNHPSPDACLMRYLAAGGRLPEAP